MHIIGLCGSPRRNGNTATLLGELTAAAQERNAVAEILFLCDHEIMQCDGCLYCEEKGCRGHCSIHDDMTKVVVPRILSADALVFGTPSYFDLPTGLLKVFMDRSNMALTKLSEKKFTYATVVVGQSDMTSLAAATEAIHRYASVCHMQFLEGCALKVVARDIGDAAKNAEAVATARRIGQRLATQETTERRAR